MVDTQRYWDGHAWTDHIAPGPARSGPQPVDLAAVKATSDLELWGWLGAFFFAPVGIVIGIMLIARPGKNKGGWILGISAGWIVLVLAALSLQQPTYY